MPTAQQQHPDHGHNNHTMSPAIAIQLQARECVHFGTCVARLLAGSPLRVTYLVTRRLHEVCVDAAQDSLVPNYANALRLTLHLNNQRLQPLDHVHVGLAGRVAKVDFVCFARSVCFWPLLLDALVGVAIADACTRTQMRGWWRQGSCGCAHRRSMFRQHLLVLPWLAQPSSTCMWHPAP